ncbi:GNAT family N-acetyltransferase [Pseudomonas viridiflava]|uniref:GNAT family N-acetyltransferase n=1 Tax=Pseudomonas viridiflava TaxID=33069 RepID=UPI0018E5BCFD|nr:GNAT family N-acetyltransferase [Pseudomonas viridiflava]MBI6727317.1 GNAT family N-acetyltransferase [Pseudomonas viridiflava]
MKVVRLSGGIAAWLEQGAINIAYESAKQLSAFSMVEDDPFEPLAQAEVCTRLRSDFYLIGNPMNAGAVKSRGEAIFVIDESLNPPLVVGFATYKPRFPEFTSASIGYIAVLENYRGQGIMRLIMDEMLEHHPILALDCPIELVPLYEKFGFYVSGSQGGHIVMETGPITGQIFSFDTEDLMKEPPLRAAKQKISKALGSQSDAGYRNFNRHNELAVSKAEAFVASKKGSQES